MQQGNCKATIITGENGKMTAALNLAIGQRFAFISETDFFNYNFPKCTEPREMFIVIGEGNITEVDVLTFIANKEIDVKGFGENTGTIPCPYLVVIQETMKTTHLIERGDVYLLELPIAE